MLIEAAHCEKSNLFLQSEPVTEKKKTKLNDGGDEEKK
jgi:hypothetical protein